MDDGVEKARRASAELMLDELCVASICLFLAMHPRVDSDTKVRKLRQAGTILEAVNRRLAAGDYDPELIIDIVAERNALHQCVGRLVGTTRPH